jgi:hypothetical protein
MNRVACVLGGLWALMVAWVVWSLPDEAGGGPARDLALLSLVYPIYYFVVSWGVTLKGWRRRHAAH